MNTCNYSVLYKSLGYSFQDTRLLEQALTHKSYNIGKSLLADNERFEFLGDAVLGLVVSDLLMIHFPELSEGGLSKFRASLVNERGLSSVAVSLNLGSYLRMGRGEEVSGGRQKNSLLSDAFEALIAAIFMDSRKEGGLGKVYEVIKTLFVPKFPNASDTFVSHDFKSELQEYAQKHFAVPATYTVVREWGPDHKKTFELAAMIKDQEYGRGTGMNKKEAGQAAAKIAITALKTQTAPSK